MHLDNLYRDKLFWVISIEDFDNIFKHDEAEVRGQGDVQHWLRSLEDARVALSGVGLWGHEDTDAILEEQDLISVSDFEEGIALD